MAYREEIQIDGRPVAFRASKLTTAKYRLIYGRNLERDLEDLEIAVATNFRGLSSIEPKLLQRFGNIAHLMASEADPTIERNPDRWFEHFREFNVFDVAPRLAYIWRSRRGTPSADNRRGESEALPADPREKARSVISQRITENHYRGIEVGTITINDDLGVEEAGSYIVLVNLTCILKRDRLTLRSFIESYSADLAATIAAQCPEIREFIVFWSVPKIGKATIKHNFERSGEKLIAVY